MLLSKKTFYIIISFLISIFLVCIFNYLLQIVAIFLVFVKRLSSSTAFIIVLWIVTGIFSIIFTASGAEYLIGKKDFSHRFTGNTILIISLVMILTAIILMLKGHFKHNPSEFTLLLSNGYVFISFFTGAGIMAAIMRNLDE